MSRAVKFDAITIFTLCSYNEKIEYSKQCWEIKERDRLDRVKHFVQLNPFKNKLVLCGKTISSPGL
jgi:hypothetical protein